eukprot:2572803-Prymnesium_polylepis.2
MKTIPPAISAAYSFAAGDGGGASGTSGGGSAGGAGGADGGGLGMMVDESKESTMLVLQHVS